MSQICEITDRTKLDSVSNWIRKSGFQKKDHQNRKQRTCTKAVVKETTNQSPSSSGILVVEYREDEAELLVKENPSRVRSKNKCDSTRFATNAKQLASRDETIVKSEAFKRLKSKEDGTCSKNGNDNRAQHLVRSDSKHTRKHKRPHIEPVLKHLEDTSEEIVMQNISTRGQRIPYKSPENLANQDTVTFQALDPKRVQFPTVCVSNNSKEVKRYHPKPALQDIDTSSQKQIIDEPSIQSRSIEYKSAEDLANRYARVMKGLKLKESKKDRNYSPELVASSSKQIKKCNTLYQRNVLQRLEPNGQNEITKDLTIPNTRGTPSLRSKYESAEDLKTVSLNSQYKSNEYHNMQNPDTEDQNIGTNLIAEVTLEEILRSAMVNFFNGFADSFFTSIVLLFLDYVALNLMG